MPRSSSSPKFTSRPLRASGSTIPDKVIDISGPRRAPVMSPVYRFGHWSPSMSKDPHVCRFRRGLSGFEQSGRRSPCVRRRYTLHRANHHSGAGHARRSVLATPSAAISPLLRRRRGGNPRGGVRRQCSHSLSSFRRCGRLTPPPCSRFGRLAAGWRMFPYGNAVEMPSRTIRQDEREHPRLIRWL